MKSYIRLGVVLTLIISTISCADREIIRLLDDVESYINERPDSALVALESLSTTDLKSKEAEGKFALLYSMALDKNMIDVAEDSLINIAVNWYRRHGTADEKLKAYYYQGRVYQNAGDNEAAMESFVQAESNESDDNKAKGLLYKAMSGVYAYIFDLENAALYNEKAKESYRLAGDTDKYAGTLLFSSDLYYSDGKYQNAMASLDSAAALLDGMSDSRKRAYYIQSMRMLRYQEDGLALSDALGRYLFSSSAEEISWLDVVENYTYLGEYDMAKSAMEQYRQFDPDYSKEPSYHIMSYKLNEALGDYESAFNDHKNYSHISDSVSLAIAEQDTGFLRERYAKDLQVEKEKNNRLLTTMISVFSVIFLAGVVYFLVLSLRRSRKEKEELAFEVSEYRKNCALLEEERDELSKTIASTPPVDKQSLSVLTDRLGLLNKFFAATITSDADIDKAACNEVARLVDNREQFIYTTRMTFMASHPKFIAHLESKGLTEEEIGYCCLYAIGLKGKDIRQYTNYAGLYNESSAIRTKLGLGAHDTNLSNHLRTLLAQDPAIS